VSLDIDINTYDRASAIRILRAFVDRGFTPLLPKHVVPTAQFAEAFRHVVMGNDLPPMGQSGEIASLAWPGIPTYWALTLWYDSLFERDTSDQPEWVNRDPGWCFGIGLRKGLAFEDTILILELVRECRETGTLHRVSMFDCGPMLWATIDGTEVRVYGEWTPQYLKAFGA
jgi:hypothetical protein